MNLEKAIRNKFRFPSTVGLLTLEQLWDLPLSTTRAQNASLDDTAKRTNAELKAQAEESFVETKVNTVRLELEEKLEIVKHVISVRQNENEEARAAADKKAKKAELLELLHDKKKEELKGKSTSEIEAMIAAL